MILEYTQMMSTAIWEFNYELAKSFYEKNKIYKPTHKNHPSNKWVRESSAHFIWLKQLVIYLDEERKYRFNLKNSHKSALIVYHLPIFIDPENYYFRDPPQCMPDYLKCDNSIKAYRNYYKSNEKNYMAKWTNRNIPEWW